MHAEASEQAREVAVHPVEHQIGRLAGLGDPRHVPLGREHLQRRAQHLPPVEELDQTGPLAHYWTEDLHTEIQRSSQPVVTARSAR